jgi:hypothetical protein
MKYRAVLSDDDCECIRMPEKARVEDTEGKGLQWHAKVIIKNDSWKIKQVSVPTYWDESQKWRQ